MRVENDFVTFSGAASLGGNVTAAELNKEYQITRIVDADSYEVTAAVTANSSDSGNGGSSTVGTYQINTGLDTSVGGTGWGAVHMAVTAGAMQRHRLGWPDHNQPDSSVVARQLW